MTGARTSSGVCGLSLIHISQFGSDLDADTKARLAQGERIVEVLKQNRSAPVPVEKQVAILYATCLLYTSRCV